MNEGEKCNFRLIFVKKVLVNLFTIGMIVRLQTQRQFH